MRGRRMLRRTTADAAHLIRVEQRDVLGRRRRRQRLEPGIDVGRRRRRRPPTPRRAASRSRARAAAAAPPSSGSAVCARRGPVTRPPCPTVPWHSQQPSAMKICLALAGIARGAPLRLGRGQAGAARQDERQRGQHGYATLMTRPLTVLVTRHRRAPARLSSPGRSLAAAPARDRRIGDRPLALHAQTLRQLGDNRCSDRRSRCRYAPW